MALTNNQAIFSGVEFESWARRKRLITAEQYLIEHYLDKNAKTPEAGAGGGKVLLAMREMGFASLHGFDYVRQLVERARIKDVTNSIVFEVGDAVKLGYADCSFDR